MDAEQTPRENTGQLNGVQLRAGLPGAHRHMTSTFEHVAEVPAIGSGAGLIQVFAGMLQGQTSPTVHCSAILGADVHMYRDRRLTLPLQPDFEHALLVLGGDATLADQPLDRRVLYYLDRGRFGEVAAYKGPRLSAPSLVRFARPNPIS